MQNICSKHILTFTPLWILTTWNRSSRTTLLAPEKWKNWKNGTCKDHCEHWPLCCFACVFANLLQNSQFPGQEGSSSNRSNMLRLVKLSITSEFFRGIWLSIWINLAILSEKFAFARCPWRNHDDVLDSLHQTSHVHICSILMMPMRRYAKICKADFVCSELSRMPKSKYVIRSLICFDQFNDSTWSIQSLGSWQSVWIFPLFRPVSHDHLLSQWTTTLIYNTTYI